MEIKRINDKTKKIFQGLLTLNTLIVLALGIYYFIYYIIQNGSENFFSKWVFLPLLIALLGVEVILMSTLFYNSSYKSNSSADKSMYLIGFILIGLAILSIFIEMVLNGLSS